MDNERVLEISITITPDELAKCNRLLDVQYLIAAKLDEAYQKILKIVEEIKV